MESEITFVILIIIEATLAGFYTRVELGITHTYCPIKLCDVLIINGRGHYMHYLMECAATCEEDSTCLLFHFNPVEDECHLCTKEVSRHSGAIQIANLTSYSDTYADTFVYKRDVYFKNAGNFYDQVVWIKSD